MTRPKCLDLFAGGGGASLGLHRAGYDVLGVEWDAGAASVHRALGMPCLCADVSDPATWLDEVLAWLDGEPLALLWASPPCQDWSSAGKRAGATGERNGWPWTWAAVDALRAAGVRVDALAAENVPGLLHHSGSTCGDPLTCPGCYWMASIVPECAARFPVTASRMLNAVDYGVPQQRRRVILWGGPEAVRWPAPTHGEPGTLLGSVRAWATVRNALGSACDAPACIRQEMTGAVGRDASQPAPSVSGQGTMYAYDEPVGARVGPIHDSAKHPAARGDSLAPTVRGIDGAQYVALDAPPATVVATEGRGCATDPRRASRSIGRRLTPAECAALQGWPEVVAALGECATVEARYRVVGNAVPPELARVVGVAAMAAWVKHYEGGER